MNWDGHSNHSGSTPLTSVRRFMRRPVVKEWCELCKAELTADHPHLIELAARRLVCACDACALLFDNPVGAKYRRAPRRIQYLTNFRLTDAAWQNLNVPIHLAFFLRSTSAGGVVALYPSPAGATEAHVPAEAWRILAEDNPILNSFEADVEALLINRVGEARDYYRVGVDECYKLVGLIRTHWRGLSGGTTVWNEIGRFFAYLKERSIPTKETAHA